jgi:hypothetical protein
VYCIFVGFGGEDALSNLTRNGKRMFSIPKAVSLSEMAKRTVNWMSKKEDKLKWGSHEVLTMATIVNFPFQINPENGVIK